LLFHQRKGTTPKNAEVKKKITKKKWINEKKESGREKIPTLQKGRGV